MALDFEARETDDGTGAAVEKAAACVQHLPDATASIREAAEEKARAILGRTSDQTLGRPGKSCPMPTAATP